MYFCPSALLLWCALALPSDSGGVEPEASSALRGRKLGKSLHGGRKLGGKAKSKKQNLFDEHGCPFAEIDNPMTGPHKLVKYLNTFDDKGDSVPYPTSYSEDHPLYHVSRMLAGPDGGYVAEAKPRCHYNGYTGPAFTRYGGYSNVWPDGGYETSIDVYLKKPNKSFQCYSNNPLCSDCRVNDPTDIRLDWSSAINQPIEPPTHRRDFIFHVGWLDAEGNFTISASNNAPGWPNNPGRDPLEINDNLLWVTLKHHFYDIGGTGVLGVDYSVLDSEGNELKKWTYNGTSVGDIIGDTVGGNRYGWLVTNGFDPLVLDNISRTSVGSVKECKKKGWKRVFREDRSGFKDKCECIYYVQWGE